MTRRARSEHIATAPTDVSWLALFDFQLYGGTSKFYVSAVICSKICEGAALDEIFDFTSRLSYLELCIVYFEDIIASCTDKDRVGNRVNKDH